jgi:hypothetical protein
VGRWCGECSHYQVADELRVDRLPVRLEAAEVDVDRKDVDSVPGGDGVLAELLGDVPEGDALAGSRLAFQHHQRVGCLVQQA